MHSLVILSRVILFITLIYNFSLGYYTFYGLTKSYQEYFCKQKRSDNPDFVSTDFSDSLNITNGLSFNYTKNSLPEGKNYFIVPINGTLKVFTKPEVEFGKHEADYLQSYKNMSLKVLVFEYKIDKSYFKIECKNTHREMRIFVQTNTSDSYFIRDKIVYHEINKQGYFEEQNKHDNLFIKLGGGTHFYSKISCEIKKSPETCSLKQETSDNFYFCYIIIISIISFLGCLCLVGVKDHIFLRYYSELSNFINEIRGKGKFFCNPLTGDQVYLDKGEKIYILIPGPVNRAQTKTKGIPKLTDLKGSYEVLENFVYINCENKNCCLEMEENNLNIIKSYFLEISMNYKKCIVNDEENHYIETSEVIEKIAEGYCIFEVDKRESGFVLDVKNFEFLLVKQLSSLNDTLTKMLLEHNWRFFSGSYELTAMFNCLKGRMWSRNRPGSIRNTQWKLYTSDFRTIMGENGYEYKSQVNWGPSKALLSIKELDWQSLEVTPLPKTVKWYNHNIKLNKSQVYKQFTEFSSIDMNIEASKVYIDEDLKYNESNTELNNAVHDLNSHIDKFNDCQEINDIMENLSDPSVFCKKICEKKVSCINELPITYKDILKKPIYYQENSVKNKTKKLFSSIRKDERALAIEFSEIKKNELTRKEKELEKYLKENVKEKKCRQIKSTLEKHYQRINFELYKIHYFDNIFELLKEAEERENNKMTFLKNPKKVEINVNEFILNNVLPENSFKNKFGTKKPFDPKKSKRNTSKNSKKIKGKRVKVSHLKMQKCFHCSDFELNFKAAVEMNNKNLSSIKELGWNCKIRPRTVFNILYSIDRKHFKKDQGAAVLSGYLYSKVKNKLEPSESNIIESIKLSEEKGYGSNFFKICLSIIHGKDEFI